MSNVKILVKSRVRPETFQNLMDFRDYRLSRVKKRVGWEFLWTRRHTWPTIQIEPAMPFHLIGLGLADEEVSKYIRGCKHHEIPCPFEEY